MTPAPGAATALAAEVARGAARPGAARTLLLDLDGTLAPICEDPAKARIPAKALEAMRRLIRRGWNVAVVSGRPAAQARRLVPLRGARVFGSHGLEGSWNGQTAGGPPREVTDRLRALVAAGREAARGIPGAIVEEKPAGVGFHDRRVPRAKLAMWRRRVSGLLDSADMTGLEILRGRRIVEVRPLGYTKGRAVTSIPGLDGRTSLDPSLLALGDDTTDEDMFRALIGRGLGVLVGRPREGTAATRRLPSPAQVHRFLELLAASTA